MSIALIALGVLPLVAVAGLLVAIVLGHGQVTIGSTTFLVEPPR